MNSAEKIGKLKERLGDTVPVLEKTRALRLIPTTKSLGWLWIEDKGASWVVTAANGQTTHQPLSGPAYAVEFRKDTGERKIGPADLTGVYKTALSFHIVRDEDEVARIFAVVTRHIDIAYKHHCEQV